MKWIRFCSAVVATLGLTTAVQAGSLNLFGSSSFGHGKCCAPAKTCAPKCCAPTKCCRPTITKPCCPTIYTYQRKKSTLKPPCCRNNCAPSKCCAPSKHACAPSKCCHAKKGCAPSKCCHAKKCCAPSKCCAPKKCCAPTSCAPKKCGHSSFLSGWKHKFSSHSCCAPAKKCCAPKKSCAPKKCCAPTSCCPTKCCDADPCEIAELIYQSQTACYARQRRRAVDDLGDYDCQCNPEIMVALIYALNDADERVRKEAADEIGDVLSRNSCCCSAELTAALTAALGDCDRGVVRKATRALEICGYDVVKGCCEGVSCNPCDKKKCCAPSKCCHAKKCCAPAGCAPQTAPAAPHKAAPAPAPPTDPKAYFPSRLRQEQTSRPRRRFGRLAQLFGLNR